MRGWRAAAMALLVCWACAFASAHTGAAVLELRQGSVSSTVDGQATTAPVELPYNWDHEQHARPGMASFSLPFTLPGRPDGPWALYLQRIGSTFEVRLNGELLRVHGDLSHGNGADYAKSPRSLMIPAQLLRAGTNLLEVRLRADSGRRAGLSPVLIGPADDVLAAFSVDYAWRFTGSVLLVGFSVVVGAIALALWLTQSDSGVAGGRRREPVYFWAALAEFCWALRVADAAIATPPIGWVGWGTLMTACYSGWAASAMLFCHHVAGWDRHPRMRWMGWSMALMFFGSIACCWISLSRADPRWLTGWLALELVGVIGYIGVFAVATVRRPDTGRVLVGSAAVLTVLVALRDWAVIRLSDSYGETTWVRYTSVFFGIALLAIVLERFQAASTQARNLLGTLAARVADRERELASTYARLDATSREQARTLERERILRDMHDGVGSHISAAIHQIQSGQARPSELMRTLRDSLDQLKLSIDAIHMPPGDVGALLAALRYRLEPRLAASSVGLEWAVDELEPVARLDAPAMRQLQFLLFEVISNVLQHAGASVLRIEAAMHEGVLRLRAVDNGRGFDASQPPRALRQRAQAIGAHLALESQPGRTVVQLAFP
ncbi:histidine kinase [Variovorax sp. dw_954]|uniref:sensor histidine kinase n=1 Tax=Variovorax sp. dw_954 TaxID=2720078 RepID=UPI001BD4F6FB|nr:histidine kinase [Variovorax sp. dw_954]